jgi:hypothetical protein
MFFRLTQHCVEASAILSTRMTFGDEAAAKMLEANSENFSNEEQLDFALRHSNQMSSLIDARYKDE